MANLNLIKHHIDGLDDIESGLIKKGPHHASLIDRERQWAHAHLAALFDQDGWRMRLATAHDRLATTLVIMVQVEKVAELLIQGGRQRIILPNAPPWLAYVSDRAQLELLEGHAQRLAARWPPEPAPSPKLPFQQFTRTLFWADEQLRTTGWLDGLAQRVDGLSGYAKKEAAAVAAGALLGVLLAMFKGLPEAYLEAADILRDRMKEHTSGEVT